MLLLTFDMIFVLAFSLSLIMSSQGLWTREEGEGEGGAGWWGPPPSFPLTSVSAGPLDSAPFGCDSSTAADANTYKFITFILS